MTLYDSCVETSFSKKNRQKLDSLTAWIPKQPTYAPLKFLSQMLDVFQIANNEINHLITGTKKTFLFDGNRCYVYKF